ncbi:MAG: helix-turn-helix domain-containing protein [Fervidicoccaceae archaeon]
MKQKLVHMLSKEARRRILEVLARERGSEAAEVLGISRAALSKFLNGKIHPSDEVVERAISSANSLEMNKILVIIAEDIADFARELADLIRNHGEDFKSPELINEALRELERAAEELRESTHSLRKRG